MTDEMNYVDSRVRGNDMMSTFCAILITMEPKFEPLHRSIEQEIAKLSAEIQRGRIESPDAQREAVRRAVGERIGQIAPPSAQPAAKQSSGPQSPVLPKYMQDAPAAAKLEVERLIDFAFHKGLMAAVDKAKKDSPYLLDAFHDALTDKLYGEMKKRGIIK